MYEDEQNEVTDDIIVNLVTQQKDDSDNEIYHWSWWQLGLHRKSRQDSSHRRSKCCPTSTFV